MSELDSPSDKDLSAHGNEALIKLVRKYRKKLRQIEKLETANKELSQEEKEKVYIVFSNLMKNILFIFYIFVNDLLLTLLVFFRNYVPC